MTSRPTTKSSTPQERPSSVRVVLGTVTVDVDLITGAVTAEGASHLHGSVDTNGVHIVQPCPDLGTLGGLLRGGLDTILGESGGGLFATLSRMNRESHINEHHSNKPGGTYL